MPASQTAPERFRQGVLLALAAFGFWGLVPIYFKSLGPTTPLEVVCHRVIWSVPLTALMVTYGQGWRSLASSLRSFRTLATLVLTTALVTTNWFVFIYAVGKGQVLQSSLGYYLNPLVNVLLGMLFLGERLRPRQWVAVGLAAAGTANLTIQVGGLPWISLTLAISFGLYGYFRKTVRGVESVGGLFVETALASPLAIGSLIWLGGGAGLAFGSAGWGVTALLLSAGVVTSVPLVAFTAASRRIPLSTLGLIQYLTPTLHFLLAVLAFGEPLRTAHLVTFGLIWTGLAVYALDSWSGSRSIPSVRN